MPTAVSLFLRAMQAETQTRLGVKKARLHSTFFLVDLVDAVSGESHGCPPRPSNGNRAFEPCFAPLRNRPLPTHY
ncbi:hypothetical protein RB213_001145 [Colletotrichum asianum]